MKNVFVLGLDPFNRELLEALPEASEVRFHALLTFEEIRGQADYPVEQLLALCNQRLVAFKGSIDGFMGYFDFPVTLMVPLLCERYDTPGPSFESVVHCEHKLWSRLLQQKVVPDCVPRFVALNPYEGRTLADVGLMPPFWLKPVKSFRSYLAYQITDEARFAAAMEKTRDNVACLVEPFDRLLDRLDDLPPAIAERRDAVCIAESQMGGSQCTVEGYVYQGEVTVYGVVDSVLEADSSSFHRYEYPSRLPTAVQDRMGAICRAVLPAHGYTYGAFNIEFFYNQSDDTLGLLEINPRHSQSHAYLFRQLHGVANHQVMLKLALGERPNFPPVRQPVRRAAKYMLRTHTDGFVTAVPGQRERAALAARQPDAHLEVLACPGQRLSDLLHQDSYSFEVADLYLTADDAAMLDMAYEGVRSILTFRIAQETDMPLNW
ncbi:MAG: ATP-grasp domain-containing protein [Nitrococcus mobilis]|nr:ATP-grasp domain-containing protein [Nitrococcus mobilis]